jgi:exopolyphosphatase/pppGpp-phosphohydrolase
MLTSSSFDSCVKYDGLKGHRDMLILAVCVVIEIVEEEWKSRYVDISAY